MNKSILALILISVAATSHANTQYAPSFDIDFVTRAGKCHGLYLATPDESDADQQDQNRVWWAVRHQVEDDLLSDNKLTEAGKVREAFFAGEVFGGASKSRYEMFSRFQRSESHDQIGVERSRKKDLADLGCKWLEPDWSSALERPLIKD